MTEEPPRDAPGEAPKKKRRRRRRAAAPAGATPHPDQPGATVPHEERHLVGHGDIEETARRALGELDHLVGRVLKELGRPAGEGDAAEVVLPLPLLLTQRPGDVRTRAKALLESVRERVSAATVGTAAFVEGHVYCFHTNQPESPYSHPPHPTSVFAGYGPTGKPEWISFPNLCLARKEPRVDRLYGDPPEVLALVQGPGELDAGLLPSFGRDSLAYRLLGQVVLGLVPRDLDPRSRAERVALSIQIVETSQPGLRHRLRMNLIGLSLEAVATLAADQHEMSPAEGFRRVLRATRGRVDALGRQQALAHRRGEAFDLTGQVSSLLVRLRADVLRVLKSRAVRTRHAEERHQSGERPTSLALADALAAGDGRFLRDEHKNTIVVLGPKSRVHVFSGAGKHVTSLELQPAEVDRRLELRRWRFLERLQSELFKDTLRRTLNPDEPHGEQR